MSTPDIGQIAAQVAFEEMRRRRAAHGNDDDSGFGHRRASVVGEVVSLGSTALILFWICVIAVLAGFLLGLFVSL